MQVFSSIRDCIGKHSSTWHSLTYTYVKTQVHLDYIQRLPQIVCAKRHYVNVASACLVVHSQHNVQTIWIKTRECHGQANG